MAHADFVHLRVRTAYSLLEGAIRLDRARRDLQRLAHAGLRHRRSRQHVRRARLLGSLPRGRGAADRRLRPRAWARRGEQPGRQARAATWLLLLAQNEAGYRNLMALTSRRLPPGRRRRAASRRPGPSSRRGRTGLLALTGGPAGPVGRLLVDGQIEGCACEMLLPGSSDIFPGRLYVELMRHGLAEEAQIEAQLIALADELELPLVATSDAYFLREETYERPRRAPLHRPEQPCGRREPAPPHAAAPLPPGGRDAHALRRPARGGRQHPGRGPALRRHGADAQTHPAGLRHRRRRERGGRAAQPRPSRGWSAASKPRSGTPTWTRMNARPRRPCPTARTTRLRARRHHRRCTSRATSSSSPTSCAGRRQEGIPVGPGRGSGAGSVAAWALTITDLDPLRFGLLFERFLNPERVSMPDFDIDFCPGPTRPGHRLCVPALRQGPGRPDHHLRQAPGPRRAARRRSRSRARLRPRRSPVQAGALQPRQPGDPAAGAGYAEPRLAAERDGDPGGGAADRDRAAPRRACTAMPRPTPRES